MNNSLLEGVVSPPVSSPEYNDFLKEYISNHCDLYIPFLDDELETCAQLIKNDPKLRSRCLFVVSLQFLFVITNHI